MGNAISLLKNTNTRERQNDYIQIQARALKKISISFNTEDQAVKAELFQSFLVIKNYFSVCSEE